MRGIRNYRHGVKWNLLFLSIDLPELIFVMILALQGNEPLSRRKVYPGPCILPFDNLYIPQSGFHGHVHGLLWRRPWTFSWYFATSSSEESLQPFGMLSAESEIRNTKMKKIILTIKKWRILLVILLQLLTFMKGT